MSTGAIQSGENEAFNRALGQALEALPTGFGYQTTTNYNPETNEAIRLMTLELERGKALAKFQELPPHLQNDPEVAQLMAEIKAAPDLTSVRAYSKAVDKLITSAKSWEGIGINVQDQQSREDEQKLLADLTQYRNDSRAARDEFERQGYGDTKENKDKLDKLWTKMDGLKPFSAEWVAAWEEIHSADAGYFAHVKEEALKRGDLKTAEKAAQCIKDADLQHKKIEEIQKVNEAKRVNEVSTTSHANVGRATFDDDEPRVVQNERVSAETVNQEAKQEQIEIGQLAAPQFTGAKQPSGGGRMV